MSPSSDAIHIPHPETLVRIDPEAQLLENNHIVGFQANDLRSRPFNLLRSQIIKSLEARKWKLIGITSATPAAGKSFLSLNLAAALSCLPNQSIYLFDFDLRRCSLAKIFGLEGEVGLSEYLNGETDDLQSIGRKIGDGNLALFPSYSAVFNSAELVGGNRMQNLIAAMRHLPEDAIVICDLPPAFANDDTLMMTQKLDAYMLVLEQGITSKKQIQNTVSMLDPTPCLGTVLNRYSGVYADPYGYGDAAYSKYYSK